MYLLRDSRGLLLKAFCVPDSNCFQSDRGPWARDCLFKLEIDNLCLIFKTYFIEV